MSVRHPTGRLAGILAAATALTLALGGPIAGLAGAQESGPQESPPSTIAPRWEGSAFTAEDLRGATIARRTTTQFDLSGVFVRTRPNDIGSITDVDYAFESVPVEGFELPADADCIPTDVEAEIADPPSQAPAQAQARAEFDTLHTSAEGEPSVDTISWPCNGRFTVTATAEFRATPDSATPETQSLSATITVAVPPPAPAEVTATKRARRVTVSWAPVPDSVRQLVGYRVERAGPANADGAFGDFAPVGGDRVAGDELRVVDEVGDDGAYRYRVRTLRAGVDGPILSAETETARVDVDVSAQGPPTAPSSDRPAPTVPGLGAGGSGRPSKPTNVTPGRTPPTTIDLGFDENLEYGDIPEPGGDGDLAGESGSSIINLEEQGNGFAVPFAGAMVLLGWAGHILYLNRLARQF